MFSLSLVALALLPKEERDLGTLKLFQHVTSHIGCVTLVPMMIPEILENVK